MKMRKLIALCLIVMLVCANALASTVNVEYCGQADKILMSSEDLFVDFKDLMPGDTVTQTIHVQNSTDTKVKIYLRADAVAQEDREFLNQFRLKVTNADAEIFDAPAGEQAGLAKEVLLGTFKKRGGTDLTVTLILPVEAGNICSNGKGTIPWTFIVEETGSGSGGAKTGDEFNLTLWLAVAGGVILLMILIPLLVRRKREKTGN